MSATLDNEICQPHSPQGQPNPFAQNWQGLLGRGFTAGAINKDVQEIQKVLQVQAETIKPGMEAHKTAGSEQACRLAR
jgi:hypothetical protein